jgi:DNA helicase-2/ATP-dependent DNA helicase PcrA
MDFESRYKQLNKAQQAAVDTIDGPVMVIAGPGTGKTELLGMRAANILRKTDTLPQNILCLTFTESGAAAMRQRLTTIIGRDAYKIAIHTFHSFCTDIIGQHRADFYRGAEFRAADELATYQILRAIFDDLPPDSPLGAMMNDEYTYLRDAARTISELKRNGLTSAELLSVLDQNDLTLNAAENLLAPVFANKISKTTAEALAPHVKAIRDSDGDSPLLGIAPLSRILADSLAEAIENALAGNTTKPVTAWKNAWIEKDDAGKPVFKARKHQEKLRAVAAIYDAYRARMQADGLYDFDDMILEVVHAIENNPSLKYDLQEKYLYVMADEFQDTNLSQMRILAALADNPVGDEPNILVVGDDDQAIFSFQGADVGNIIGFQDLYPSATRIVLTDNYRSTQLILDHARTVIRTGADRLENRIPGLSKELTAHQPGDNTTVELIETPVAADERQWLVDSIKKQLNTGVKASDIAVLARDHKSIIRLLPALHSAGLSVNYERRDNVLDLPIIRHIELIAGILVEISSGHYDHAETDLPELLAHPAWGVDPLTVWKLSLTAKEQRKSWLEIMADMPELQPIHSWLMTTGSKVLSQPLEQMMDIIIGKRKDGSQEDFMSPVFEYYFGDSLLEKNPDDYLTCLEALRTIRSRLRDYRAGDATLLPDFLDFIDLHRRLNITITSIRPSFDRPDNAISLMTAHKSKGLEFDTVYIVGAIDSVWGERVRSPGRLIGYPANLPFAPAGNTPDERLRLFFVAMTRAKRQLFMTYSLADDSGKETQLASFLLGENLTATTWSPVHSVESAVAAAELDWFEPLINIDGADMKQLLGPTLERYRLSATHVGSFLDVTRGGPRGFLIDHLLRFPVADTPQTAYGRVVHAVLQRAHNHTAATGHVRPLEDILHDFEQSIASQSLSDADLATYQHKGSTSLGAFLKSDRAQFIPSQRAEVDFSGQGVIVGDARLTGMIDLMNVDTENKTITLADYKTGKAARDWKGKTEYEKIKLHKYRHQLLFYKLLAENSHEYDGYTATSGTIQFVEPTKSGEIMALDIDFTGEEVAEFEKLLGAIWQRIITLDLPDTSHFEPTYKGMLAFEQELLDS